MSQLKNLKHLHQIWNFNYKHKKIYLLFYIEYTKVNFYIFI